MFNISDVHCAFIYVLLIKQEDIEKGLIEKCSYEGCDYLTVFPIKYMNSHM